MEDKKESLIETSTFSNNITDSSFTNVSSLNFNNENPIFQNIILKQTDDFLLILLNRSQLILTIIGVAANIGTSFTLFTNGQVGRNRLYCA